MSDQANERQSEEYILLKERAKALGLRVSPNIGLDALRLKVNGALTGQAASEGEDEPDDEGDEDDDGDDDDENEQAGEDDVDGDGETQEVDLSFADGNLATEGEYPDVGERVRTNRERKAEEKELRKQAARQARRGETKLELTKRLRAEALKLVRCRIYNLNPGKRDLQGEIITVGNKYVGTLKKLIPFGEATDNGYHIPQMIYDDLKQRRYQAITSRRVNGQIKVTSRMAPEYNIEVLPPLTQEELQELAMKQAAAERVQGRDD